MLARAPREATPASLLTPLLLWPLLLLLLTLAPACTERESSAPADKAGTTAGSASRIKRIKRVTRIKHTRDMTAQEYLTRQIAFYSGRIKSSPEQHIFYGPLAALYQKLAHENGELWPHKKAIDLCDAAIGHGGPKGQMSLIKARSLVALHELDAARAALTLAKSTKKVSAILPLQAEIALQTGKYHEARRTLAALAKLRRGKATAASLLAVLEDTLGNHDKALARFAEALRLIERNASGRAWVRVMRGISSMQRGRFEEARADFREAVKLAPRSVLAAEHLAEIEMRLGHLERSIAIYQGVLGLSKNPEFQAAIAEVYRKKGDAKSAAKHEAVAAKRYARWLERFPKAAYGHAVQWYLGQGKAPAKAAKLAAANARLRPSSAAFVALAEARLAAGDRAGAKTAIDRALAMPAKNARLYWVAARIYQPAKRASALRSKALAINPKQASM